MKKLLLIGVVIVFMTSCEEAKQRYTQNSPQIETAKSIIKDYNAKNYESLVTHFSDTAKVFFNSAKSFPPSMLSEYHSDGDANFPKRGFIEDGQEYEMVETDEGHIWVNFWGTWKGELAENGSVIDLQIHLTFRFINGKVVTEYGYWDGTPIVLAMQEIEKEAALAADPESNLAIVHQMYKNVSKGDIPAFLSSLDRKIVWNEAENFIYADGNPYKGPNAVLKGVFERIGADWEYFDVKNIKLHAMDDNMVLATGRYKAKHKTTGKKLNAQAAHVWTLKNGKATRFQQYTDTKQAFEAIQ